MPAPPLDGVAVEEGVDGSVRSSEIAPFKDVAAFSLLPTISQSSSVALVGTL